MRNSIECNNHGRTISVSNNTKLLKMFAYKFICSHGYHRKISFLFLLIFSRDLKYPQTHTRPGKAPNLFSIFLLLLLLSLNISFHFCLLSLPHLENVVEYFFLVRSRKTEEKGKKNDEGKSLDKRRGI